MSSSRLLMSLWRPRPMTSAANNGAGSLVLQHLRRQPTACPNPAVATLTTTLVRNYRVKPRRNRHLPPKKSPYKGHLEQMHYTCFQLAMDIIRKDRAEVAEKIKEERKRIQRVQGYLKEKPDDEMYKKRLRTMRAHLDKLLIMYDINSPRVRWNYLTKKGSMDRPIHRYFAQRDFASMRQKILKQRIDTMHLIPDVIPHLDPTVDVRLRFQSKEIGSGEFVRSRMSRKPPTVKIIPYEAKERMCTIAVVDPDVPDVERDSYTYRLHWLVTNIEINHIRTQAIGTGSKGMTVLSPYLPPYVHRGAPYHRYCLMVFDQEGRIEKPEEEVVRDGFNMRSFMGKNKLSPISAFIWRGKWDKYTKQLMQDNNIEGSNLRFVRRNH